MPTRKRLAVEMPVIYTMDARMHEAAKRLRYDALETTLEKFEG